MHVARRWSWIAVLVVGLILSRGVQQALLTTQNPNLVPRLILLGAAVMPVTFVAARRMPYGGRRHRNRADGPGRRHRRRPRRWSARVRRAAGARSGPDARRRFIEEAAKLIVLVVLVTTLRPRRRADGLVLGVAAGAGFAVLETMGTRSWR